jgi:hypothetical protein
MTSSRRTSPIRSALVGALVVGAMLPGHEAQGWANGRGGPNSYGTHDWILDKAIKKLKKRGESVDWVKLDVALKATDDPDTRDGIDYASGTWWHVYDVWGKSYGAAPTAIKYWFNQAAKRLAGGRRGKASVALGNMAHLLGDISNPMHTDQMWKEDSIHSKYETDVDQNSRRTSNVYRFSFDGLDDPSPYRKGVRVARRAHRKYDRLVDAYYRNGYNNKVHLVTKTQLNRGANAVADVAAGIKAKAKAIKDAQDGGDGGGGDTGGGGGGDGGCHPSYPDFCIPPPPPDKDCGDVNGTNFTVKGTDPHGFDSDDDGVGCES